jgi:hypothetical protein
MTITKLKTEKGRLRWVANLIANNPAEWRQESWAIDLTLNDEGKIVEERVLKPDEVIKAGRCGTFGCACGWGAAITPRDQIPSRYIRNEAWFNIGQVAFGVGSDTGNVLFSECFGESDQAGCDTDKRTRARRMVACLRWLAGFSDDERRDDTKIAVVAGDFSDGESYVWRLKPGTFQT